MLANFFGKSKPINFIVIIILFLGYFLLQSFHNYNNTMPIGSYVLIQLQELGVFMLFFALFNFIVTKNKLTFDNTYAFLFLVMLIGIFPATIGLHTTLYVNLLLTLCLRKVYSLQSSNNSYQKLFDSGFWLGVACIIEPFTSIFVLFIYGGIYVHRRTRIQSFLVPILGLAVPVFLYFTYCFWNNSMDRFYQLFDIFSLFHITQYSNTNLLWIILSITLLTFIALFMKSSQALAVNNTFRKSWILISYNLLLAIGLVFLTQEKNGTELLYALLPTAIVLANGLEMIRKKWISDLLVFSFLVVSVVLFIV